MNLSDKQSQTSVQESENVNLNDKKGQISKIKSDKSVKKVTKSHKLWKNV